MEIYLSMGSDNRIQGWGSSQGNVSDIKIDVEDDHEVLRNPFIYTYSNGVLEKDEEYQNEMMNRPIPLSPLEQLQKEQAELVFQLMEKGVL